MPKLLLIAFLFLPGLVVNVTGGKVSDSIETAPSFLFLPVVMSPEDPLDLILSYYNPGINNYNLRAYDLSPSGIWELVHVGFGIAPSWSPDGTQIVFTPLSGSGLKLMNSDGTNVRLLDTRGDAESNDWQPLWSPRGDKIAFCTRRNKDNDTELYIISPDGSNPASLANWGPFRGCPIRPVWSPDGSQLAFASPKDNKIHVVGLDTANDRSISGNPAVSPAWSPDGLRLCYDGSPDGGAGRNIFVTNNDGSQTNNLTNSTEINNSCAWSPDGSTIAFVSGGSGGTDLFFISPDGSNLVNVTNTDGIVETQPVWSPNGRKLAFRIVRNPGSFPPQEDVYVMNPDGSQRTQVNTAPLFLVMGAWNPMSPY